MDDREIVKLFWARSPRRWTPWTRPTARTCAAWPSGCWTTGRTPRSVVNDTYLSLWQGIPPGEAGPPAALRPAGHPKFVLKAQTVEHRGEALLPLRRGL